MHHFRISRGTMVPTKSFCCLALMVAFSFSATGAALAGVRLLSPANLSAAASSAGFTESQPAFAVDGSGLTGNQHGTDFWSNLFWLSDGSDIADGSAWFRVGLNGTYFLDSMKVWNYNQAAPYDDRGVQSATVYLSSTNNPGNPVDDPSNWSAVAGGPVTFTKASGLPDYGYNTAQNMPDAVALSGASAKYVALEIHSNYGQTHVGLSEVQIIEAVPNPTSPLIDPAQLTASSSTSLGTSTAQQAVNGAGLSAGSHDRNMGNMWLSSNNDLADGNAWIKVDLGGARKLEAVKLWNYNQIWSGHPSGNPPPVRGVKQADLYVSDSGIGNPIDNPSEWNLVTDYQPVALRSAPGINGYDSPDQLDLLGVSGSHLAVQIHDNFGPDFYGDYVGIAEMQFFGTAADAYQPNFDMLDPTGFTATASSQLGTAAPPQGAIDGTGLNPAGDRHTTGLGDGWLSSAGDMADGAAWFKVDLGREHMLDGMKVWNYNQRINEHPSGNPAPWRGVQLADIYVSDTGTGNPLNNPGAWQLLIDDYLFTRAAGTSDYGNPDLVFRPNMIDLGNVTTGFVALLIEDNFGTDLYGDFVGLAEVQFFGYAVPEPSSGLLLSLAAGIWGGWGRRRRRC